MLPSAFQPTCGADGAAVPLQPLDHPRGFVEVVAAVASALHGGNHRVAAEPSLQVFQAQLHLFKGGKMAAGWVAEEQAQGGSSAT